MRTTYTILALIFFIGSGLNAQNGQKVKEFYLGMQGAGSLTSIFSEYKFEDYALISTAIPPSSPYLKGYSTGISFRNYMEKSAGILIELNIVKKGGYNYFFYDTDSLSPDLTAVLFRQDLQYFELPILTDIRIGKKAGRLHFYGGPVVSYLFNQKLELLESDNGRTYLTETGRKFEFGIIGGLGFSYSVRKHVLELSARYNHSLSSIYEPQLINKAFLSQNQVISAILQYYYQL